MKSLATRTKKYEKQFRSDNLQQRQTITSCLGTSRESSVIQIRSSIFLPVDYGSYIPTLWGAVSLNSPDVVVVEQRVGRGTWNIDGPDNR